MNLIAGMLLTFFFPALTVPIPTEDLSAAESWRLYSWRDDWTVYCDCDLEFQAFDVAVVRDGRAVTVVLPDGVQAGGRYLLLVPVYFNGRHEGSGSMLRRDTVAP